MDTDKEKEKIRILISGEHSYAEEDINKAFAGLGSDVVSGLVRKSAEELPMQIVIFLGNVVISGVMWDMMKLGISRVFKNYPKASIVLHDKNSIIYNITRDGKVSVVVVPERQKEFAHIRHIYALGNYLVEETPETRIEHKQRFIFVLGVLVASAFGFLLNIFANIYYDVFLKHTVSINSFDSFHLGVLLWLFFAIIAFLQFLIYDYKNELHLDKSFWRRYEAFLMEDFVVTRIAQRIQRGFVFVLGLSVIFAMLIGVNPAIGLLVFLVSIPAGIVVLLVKDRLKKQKV